MDAYSKIAGDYDYPPELRYYICIHALFNPERNICKHWKAHQAVFMDFLEEDEEMGKKHLLQAICQFFIRSYPEKMTKFAPTFIKMMSDADIYTDEFLIQWSLKKAKTDKESLIYDKRAESKFKKAIA